MKRTLGLSITGAVIILGTLAHSNAAPPAQEKKPTAQEKMATVDYLVGSWGCAHTVGTFAGKYTTKYTKELGGRWLRQTYDFPAGQFGG